MGTAWLRGAVATANVAFDGLGLLEPVTHEPFVEDPTGGRGEAIYDSPVRLSARVVRKRGTLDLANGQQFHYRAVIGLMGQASIDPRDRITLRDGMTGPIHTPQGGLTDPETGVPFARTVYIG
jgi:hypothetical protein